MVKSKNFWPKNTGDYATYTWIIEAPEDIQPDSRKQIIVRFSDRYSSNLSPYNVFLYCSSYESSNDCGIKGDREVYFASFNS